MTTRMIHACMACQDTGAYFHSFLIGGNNAAMNIPQIRPILQQLMGGKELSATKLAELSGVPQPTISRLLNGTTETMLLETVLALANALGVTVSQLIGETPIDANQERQKAYMLLQQLPAYQVTPAVKILDALAQPAPPQSTNNAS